MGKQIGNEEQKEHNQVGSGKKCVPQILFLFKKSLVECDLYPCCSPQYHEIDDLNNKNGECVIPVKIACDNQLAFLEEIKGMFGCFL